MIHPISLSLSSMLAQLKSGITGSVGEIGTYYGTYFFSITTAALPEEPKVAIDLFEKQELNVDKSGGFVDSKRFLEHASNLHVVNLTLLSQDSSTVTVDTFLSRGMPAFRLFSVDGGHTFEATVRDLQLATCSIRPGGVIVLDDWINLDWTGVLDASIRFLYDQDNVVPFLAICNKLYLTTREYHSLYYNWVISLKCLRCSATLPEKYHSSRYELAGTRLCMDIRTGCSDWCTE